MPEDLDAVTEPIRNYFAGLNTANLDMVLSAMSDDASVMAPGAPTASGADAVRALYAERLSVFEYRRELHIDASDVSGDIAAVRCHTTGSFTNVATQQQIDAVSREVFVLRRQGITWRIATYIFNSPAP